MVATASANYGGADVIVVSGKQASVSPGDPTRPDRIDRPDRYTASKKYGRHDRRQSAVD